MKSRDDERLAVVDFADVGEEVGPKALAAGDLIGNRVEWWRQQDEFVVGG